MAVKPAALPRPMQWTKDNYVLTDDRSRIDLDAVCDLLKHTYWAHDRPRSIIEKSLEHSVCFSLFRDGQQTGFARAVTDHATFTWVCDVVIHPDHRGRGLGRWMVQTLLEHPALQTVSQHLRTDDAHGLYESFGFQLVEAMRRTTQPHARAAAMELNEIQRAAQQQFAKQSHRYGPGHILENIEDVRAAAAQISLPARAKVLDVATGGGHTGLFFAALGHEVTLADIAPAMLQQAAQAAAQRGLAVATCLHAAEQFPYPDSSFDLVTCRVAPHHFSSPEDFVGETARVLKPQGWFLLIDGSIEDDQPEAEAWLHLVEKYRDPSHHRLLSPRAWSQLCQRHGLAVRQAVLAPFKQPDLDWYFETAATSPENRSKVLELIAQAPESARKLFGLAEENGKIVWWWPRLTLIARKAVPA